MPRILIQAGHVAPREPGFEGGTGTVREQELTARVQGALAAKFAADERFAVTLCPGDIPDGWAGDVALYLHGDGSGNPSARGYSFGWPVNAPGGGPALAARIAQGFGGIGHPGGHHTDNYTGGLRHYYGYSRTHAGTKVLVEHGFLTNAVEQAWLFEHVGELAAVEYESVVDHLGLKLVPFLRDRPAWADLLQLWITPPGKARRIWVGWEQAWPAVEWVAARGLRTGALAAIAWHDLEHRRVERDPKTVVAVCRALVDIHRRGAWK